jgi:hypothetical protein
MYLPTQQDTSGARDREEKDENLRRKGVPTNDVTRRGTFGNFVHDELRLGLWIGTYDWFILSAQFVTSLNPQSLFVGGVKSKQTCCTQIQSVIRMQ